MVPAGRDGQTLVLSSLHEMDALRAPALTSARPDERRSATVNFRSDSKSSEPNDVPTSPSAIRDELSEPPQNVADAGGIGAAYAAVDTTGPASTTISAANTERVISNFLSKKLHWLSCRTSSRML